jgi:lysophospholipid hydrolase
LRRYTSEIEGDDDLLGIASLYFGTILRLSKDEVSELIRPKIRIVSLEEGQEVYRQGSVEGAALVIVVSGMLQITPESSTKNEYTGKKGNNTNSGGGDDEDDDHSYHSPWKAYVYHRELICSCGLQLLANEPAVFTISAATQSTIAVMERSALEVLVDRKPSVVLPIAYSVLIRMSPFLRSVDFAIDWILLDSGETVYR